MTYARSAGGLAVGLPARAPCAALVLKDVALALIVAWLAVGSAVAVPWPRALFTLL